MIREEELEQHDKEELERLVQIRVKGEKGDKEVGALLERFIRCSFLFEQEEADLLTRAFVELIAGVSWDDSDRYNQVGKNLNGVGKTPPNDHVAFWTRIHDSIPGFITKDQLEWLKTNDKLADGAFELFWYLSNNCPYAHVADKFAVYIHSWK